MANWNHLQAKVFKKIGLSVPENVVSGVVNNKAGVVEVVLNNLRIKIDQVRPPLAPAARSNALCRSSPTSIILCIHPPPPLPGAFTLLSLVQAAQGCRPGRCRRNRLGGWGKREEEKVCLLASSFLRTCCVYCRLGLCAAFRCRVVSRC